MAASTTEPTAAESRPAQTTLLSPAPLVGIVYAPRTRSHGERRSFDEDAIDPLHVYANRPEEATGWVSRTTNDGSIVKKTLRPGEVPARLRVRLAIAFPQDSGLQPRFMIFDRTKPIGEIRTVIKSMAGGGMGAETAARAEAADERRFMLGSPERLNLFSLVTGRILRPDLEVEAVLGTDDMHDGDVLVLEAGNRLPEARVEEVRRFVRMSH